MFAIINIVIFYIISVILYATCIYMFSNMKFVSERKHLEHQVNKQNLPIYGGIIIMASLIPFYYRIEYLALVLYGFIGIIDDLLKQYKKALNFYYKMILQISFFMILIYLSPQHDNILDLFLIKLKLPSYIMYIFQYLTIVGTSNGVNITDGLDGLAGYNIFNLSLVLAIIAMLSNSYDTAALMCALCGSILGFLTFNIYPAKIIMGDNGALGIGAMLAMSAIVLHAEIIIPLSGIYFLIASLSVIIQVLGYKIFKKRLIPIMTPVHHGLEKLGYKEAYITQSINIFSIIFSVMSLYLYYILHI